MADLQIYTMSKMITLCYLLKHQQKYSPIDRERSYSSPNSIPGLENGNLMSMLKKDIRAPKTGKPSTDDTNMKLLGLGDGGSYHVKVWFPFRG